MHAVTEAIDAAVGEQRTLQRGARGQLGVEGESLVALRQLRGRGRTLIEFVGVVVAPGPPARLGIGRVIGSAGLCFDDRHHIARSAAAVRMWRCGDDTVSAGLARPVGGLAIGEERDRRPLDGFARGQRGDRDNDVGSRGLEREAEVGPLHQHHLPSSDAAHLAVTSRAERHERCSVAVVARAGDDRSRTDRDEEHATFLRAGAGLGRSAEPN